MRDHCEIVCPEICLPCPELEPKCSDLPLPREEGGGVSMLPPTGHKTYFLTYTIPEVQTPEPSSFVLVALAILILGISKLVKRQWL